MERNTKRKLVDIGILTGACLVVALLLRTPLFGGIAAYLVMVASLLVTVVLYIVCSIVCLLFGDVPDFSDFAGFTDFCTEGEAWYYVILFAMAVVWTIVVVQILNEKTPKLPESLKKSKEPVGYKVLDHVEVRRKEVVDKERGVQVTE